jgi:hypothetical protein
MYTVRQEDRRYDIEVRKGSTRTIYWKVNDPTTGQPKDLNGWSVHCQVRVAPDEDALLLYEWVASPTAAQGQSSTDNGRGTLYLDPIKTGAWAWNEGYYDCELISPDGTQVEELGWGRFTARNQVTN